MSGGNIMCFGGGGAPTPQMPAPPPQRAQGDPVGAQMAAIQRQRAAASNTTLTSGQGVTMMYPTQGKVLIGS
jgi:hypothetical protein